MDSPETSRNKLEMDKKIENIIQKYDNLPSFDLSQNSFRDKSRDANDKYGSPGLSNISEKNINSDRNDSGFLDPNFISFLEKANWEQEVDPVKKARKLELYKQLYELERGQSRSSSDKVIKADFKKKGQTGTANGVRAKQSPFSKITEEPSEESDFSKIPTLKDPHEANGLGLSGEKSKRNFEKKPDCEQLEIVGNYADLMRVDTSQSVKGLQKNEARGQSSKDVKYKSDRVSKKGKSFLMEFENQTRTSRHQDQTSPGQKEKIKRLIQSSYAKEKQWTRGSQASHSEPRPGSRGLEEPEAESQGPERPERRDESEHSQAWNGEHSANGNEESREGGQDSGWTEEDLRLSSREFVNSDNERRSGSGKFHSKREEYRKSREVFNRDLHEHGLRGKKRQNFLRQNEEQPEEGILDSNPKFLSPPKSGRRNKPKKPKRQEMNYYEQERRRKESLERTQEMYLKGRTKSGKKSSKLVNKAFRKKNYGNTNSKVDTGRFAGKYKFDKKLREHYGQQSRGDSGELDEGESRTYTVSHLMQKKKQMRPLHRDLKPIYDGLNYTDDLRRGQAKRLNQSGKRHRNMCWNFEKEHNQKKREIMENYYRNFDT